MVSSRTVLCILFAAVCLLAATEARKNKKRKCVVWHCFADPCSSATCPAFKDATCKPNYCGGCKAEFFVDGAKVNCYKKFLRKRGCPKGCNKMLRPVCGSDKVTYDNPCLFKKAKCEKENTDDGADELKIVKPVACDVDYSCPRTCALIYQPVCGSNGVLYANKCALQQAKFCDGKDVKFARMRKCKKGGKGKRRKGQGKKDEDNEVEEP